MSESRTARGGGGRTPLLRCCPLLGQGRAGPAAGRSGLQSGALLLLRTPASLGKMTPSMATQGASYLPSSTQLRLTPAPTRPPMCGLPGTPTTLSWSWERSEGLGARAHLPALQVGLCAGYSWGGGVCVLGVQPEAPPPPPARRWGSHMDCEQQPPHPPGDSLVCRQVPGSRTVPTARTPRRVVHLTFPPDFEVQDGEGTVTCWAGTVVQTPPSSALGS